MQFSDTSNDTGVLQDITFLTGLDTNAYPNKDRTRNINRWYYLAVVAAWKAQQDWEFDDSNQTGFPVATTDLVDDQKDYTIPTNALKILRVEVKDNSGNWHLLQPIDETQVSIALDEYKETKGLPETYRVTRRSVLLYPSPSNSLTTLTAGLKIYFLREVDEFTASDTTQEPGIAEPFHRILSLGASFDGALAKGLSNQATLRTETEELFKKLEEFYAGRHRNFKTKIRPVTEKYK